MPTVSEHTRAVNKINEMKSRWGVSASPQSVGAGTLMTASNTNGLIDVILEGKSKSGWGGGVSGKVSVGSHITNIFAALYDQAEAIRAHCQCNCNHCACNCQHCACNSECSCICDNCCAAGCDGPG